MTCRSVMNTSVKDNRCFFDLGEDMVDLPFTWNVDL